MEKQEITTEVACRVCGQIHAFEEPRAGWRAECRRCRATLSRRSEASLETSAAFAISALLLYAPANLFPILRMDLYGATTENTVWQGCVRLYRDGNQIIALIVFLASILIPLLKLLGLFFLVLTSKYGFERWKYARTKIYVVIDAIGRWAMLDVFVLAVLVSLVKLHRLATIIPGRGALAFAGVVVFTLLASASFDPQMIWLPEDRR